MKRDRHTFKIFNFLITEIANADTLKMTSIRFKLSPTYMEKLLHKIDNYMWKSRLFARSKQKTDSPSNNRGDTAPLLRPTCRHFEYSTCFSKSLQLSLFLIWNVDWWIFAEEHIHRWSGGICQPGHVILKSNYERVQGQTLYALEHNLSDVHVWPNWSHTCRPP